MEQTKEKKEKKKLTKKEITSIAVAVISAVTAIALIITNFFVPVKYLASYLVLRNGGAAEGVMRVRFVDAGYGDCIIIELPDGKNMLVDAGNGSSTNQAKIIKYLNKCDIDEIDYLVCTSVNSEHCGGLTEIIKYKTVNRIYMPYCTNIYVTDEYRDFALAAQDSGAELIISEYGIGEADKTYGYFFCFLSPSIHDLPDGEYAALNANPTSAQARCNASAVMWLEYAGTSFLFTSDVRTETLLKLYDYYNIPQEDYFQIDGYSVNLETCNILKVANHGNENSVCDQLYNLLSPEISVITVGENGQGCPSLNSLSYNKLYRTDEHGTVTIEVNSDGYKII